MVYLDLFVLFTIRILPDTRIIIVLRNSEEIIAKILECVDASVGVSKTRLMYRVQLSFAQAKEYLRFIQQCELLIYDEENNVFRTTMKGKRFLTLYREIIELIFWGRREWTPKLRSN